MIKSQKSALSSANFYVVESLFIANEKPRFCEAYTLAEKKRFVGKRNAWRNSERGACTQREASVEEFAHIVCPQFYCGESLLFISHKKSTLSSANFYGGEEEIRTLEPLLTVTRFPVARPRPN